MQETNMQQIEKLASHVAAIQAILDRLRGEDVEIPPEVQRAVDACLEAKICLRCQQVKGGKYTRGNCANCYNDTIKRINAGEASERELVQMGRLTKEAKAGGRKKKLDRPDVSQLTPLTLAPEITAEEIAAKLDQHDPRPGRKKLAKEPPPAANLRKVN